MQRDAKTLFDPEDFINGYHIDEKTGKRVKNFHDKQVELLKLKDSYILCITGRRPGKTHALAGKIVLADQTIAPHKEGFILYATTTLGHAHELIFNDLKKWNRIYKLGWDWSQYKKWGIILTPNGNIIRLLGLHDEESWKKPQGLPIKLSITDESQLIKSKILKSFDEEICTMGLLDFSEIGEEHEGQMIVAGNPPKRHIGHLTEMWRRAEKLEKNKDENEGMTIVRFHMSIKDNPYYNEKQIKSFFAFTRKRLGLKEGEENPAFLRNCYGIWAEETDTKVYNITEENYFKNLPESAPFTTIMGIDLGYSHHDAIAVLKHFHESKKTYVIHEWQDKKKTISQLASEIIKTNKKFPEINLMVADFGALGVKIKAELRKTHGLKIKAAKKTEKMDWVEKLRDLVNQKKILFKSESLFALDSKKIDYDENFEKIDDKSFHSDIHDAVLYPMRWIMQKFPSHFILDENDLSEKEKLKKEVPEFIKEDRELFDVIEENDAKRKNFKKMFKIKKKLRLDKRRRFY